MKKKYGIKILCLFIVVFMSVKGFVSAAQADDLTNNDKVKTDIEQTNANYSMTVEMFYKTVLDRNPDSDGLNYFINLLEQEIITEAQVGVMIFLSNEYNLESKKPEEIITDLYTGFLSRIPDQMGWEYWKSEFDKNSSIDHKESVIRMFAASEEFSNRWNKIDEESIEMVKTDAGANRFAFQLSGELLKEIPESENFICSPFSAWIPLVSLINAVDEQEQEQLLKLLCENGMSLDDVNQSLSQLITILQGDEQGESFTSLQIENILFLNEKYKENKKFTDVFSSNYQGMTRNVNFNSIDAIQEMNEWAEKNTKGLIKNISSHISAETSAIMVNGLSYSAEWSSEFDLEKTTEGMFYSPSGELNVNYMLRDGDEYTEYYEDENLQAVNLPLQGVGSLYILLPKNDDATTLLSSMDTDYFTKIEENMVYSEGELLLPRFSIATTPISLIQALENMGIPYSNEAFTGLTKLDAENTPMWISDIVQSSSISADEKGVSATAQTELEFVYSKAPEPKMFMMNCDKPFVFILCGQTQYSNADISQVLFTGIINQPDIAK